MPILVTNDDGVSSAGLHALARALVEAGLDVVVAAPDREQSGTSASIGQVNIDRPIDAEPVKLPGLDGVPSYAVGGPPGLCVLAARLGGFGPPPELVVSGINPGCNTGRAVLHSGTVGAALTAANFGVSGLAVSLDVSSRLLHEQAAMSGPAGEMHADAVVAEVVPAEDEEPPAGADRSAAHWDTAAALGAWYARWVLDSPLGTVLNVNVPNLPFDQLRGVGVGELAEFGTVRTRVVEPATATTKLQLELRRTDDEMPPESDSGLVNRGFVSITPLRGITIDTGADVRGALELGLPGSWAGG